MLLNMKSAPLKFKDKDEKATVHFRTTVSADEGPVSAPRHKYGSSVQKTPEACLKINSVNIFRLITINITAFLFLKIVF